jgi:hypothetical protein
MEVKTSLPDATAPEKTGRFSPILRKLFWAAGAELLLIVLVLLAWKLAPGQNTEATRRVVLLFGMLLSVATIFAPLFAVRGISQGPLLKALLRGSEPVFWTLAAFLSGPLLLAIFCDTGSVMPWLKVFLLAASGGLASSTLLIAAVRLSGNPRISTIAHLLLLGLFCLQPFYVRPAISAARTSPRLQRTMLALGMRTPWVAAANTMAAALPDGWRYQVLTTPSLYNRWIGTDFSVSTPTFWRYLVENLAAALLLAALGALRGNKRKQVG